MFGHTTNHPQDKHEGQPILLGMLCTCLKTKCPDPQCPAQMDNCGSQNKNRFVFAFFQYIITKKRWFKKVVLFCLPVGHTHQVNQNFVMHRLDSSPIPTGPHNSGPEVRQPEEEVAAQHHVWHTEFEGMQWLVFLSSRLGILPVTCHHVALFHQ